MSVPGPNARQFWELPPHVEFEKSQSIPVSLHLGPLIFGDTSPELDEANAATNGPCNDILFLIKCVDHVILTGRRITNLVLNVCFYFSADMKIRFESSTKQLNHIL